MLSKIDLEKKLSNGCTYQHEQLNRVRKRYLEETHRLTHPFYHELAKEIPNGATGPIFHPHIKNDVGESVEYEVCIQFKFKGSHYFLLPKVGEPLTDQALALPHRVVAPILMCSEEPMNEFWQNMTASNFAGIFVKVYKKFWAADIRRSKRAKGLPV